MLWLWTSFRWYVWGMPLRLLDQNRRHFSRNSSEKLQHRKRWSYLLKSSFKCSLQKHHIAYVSEVIIKCYSNFITCLYFPLALIWWNSSHSHLIIELFKSKENFKEKVDSNNNWKTAGPGMTLEWHLFLWLSLGFVRKMLSFMRKHLSFYPEDVCSFSVLFI